MKIAVIRRLLLFLTILLQACATLGPTTENRSIASINSRCESVFAENTGLTGALPSKAGLKLSDAKALYQHQRFQESAWLAKQIGENEVASRIEAEILTTLKTGEDFKMEPMKEGPTESVSEVYLVTFANGHKAVFKPSAEFWKDKNKYHGVIANPKSDYMASRFARILEFDPVPLAVTRTLEGMEGSLQAYVNMDLGLNYTYTEMQNSAFRNMDYNYRELPIKKKRNILKLFDYLIYNTDRHPRNTGNWISFQRYPKEIEPGQGSGLVAFDNSAAFQSYNAAKGNFPPLAPVTLRLPFEEVAEFLQPLQQILTEEVIIREMTGFFADNVIQETLHRRQLILKFYKMLPKEPSRRRNQAQER